MEKRVVKQTNQKIANLIWGKGTRPGSKFWLSLSVGLCVGGLLTVWSLDTSPIQKAIDEFCRARLSIFKAPSGNEIQLRNYPVTNLWRGYDISIFADITRGHRGEKSLDRILGAGGRDYKLGDVIYIHLADLSL